ncbi:MAG TPA: multidrug ABC transporter [Treponema sp.]|nr:multidrug ABC transporter [Treponema sp.]
MNNIKYIILLLFSVFISTISQILLKKSALEKHPSWIREYLNIKVIIAYSLFFTAVLIDLLALKFVQVSFVPVIETSSYVFIIILGRIIFNEKINIKQTVSLLLIISGIFIYIW